MKKIAVLILIIFVAVLFLFLELYYNQPNISVSTQSNNNITEPEISEEIKDILAQAKILEPFIADAEKIPEYYNIVDELKNAIESKNNFDEALENFKITCLDSKNQKKSQESNLISKLYIGDVKCAYDEKLRTFYYTMGKQSENREFKFDFKIESALESNIFAEIFDSDGNKKNYKFIPEINREYNLKFYSKNVISEYKLIFTMLPIIQIENINRIGDNYRNCKILITDPDFTYNYAQYKKAPSHLFIETTAKIHVRGGISRNFLKKSYAIKFIDEYGQTKNISIFGMRKDSDWILDAMYIDKARMRNRVSTDLWNEYNSELNYISEVKNPQSNGTHGIFAEVFIGREYMGLYCLTEKIDRKQLQLLKNDNYDGKIQSVIYKGISWEEPVLFNNYKNYRYNRYWGGFEQIYPNPVKGGEIYWETLYQFVKFVVNSTDKEFKNNIAQYIEIDNFVDYTLLLFISFAIDNTGKNCFWSVYDINTKEFNKIFITPWDLDATWGRSWESSKVKYSETYAWMNKHSNSDSNLLKRLLFTNAGGFTDKLKNRWDELKNNILSPENISEKFETFFKLFDKSGAWERESNRWKECDLNLESERKYIKEWAFDRWKFIDNYIKKF